MAQTSGIVPVEKLPLAARKNIRDEFDANIGNLINAVSDLLGQPYKLEVNFHLFYAYAVAADSSWVKSSPGVAAFNYFESFHTYLKDFTEEGTYTDAVEAFNELVTERRISLEADPSVTYSDCRVRDGAFELTFSSTSPGVNVSYACQEMPKRFDEGLFAKDPDALPMIAKRNIRDEFERKKEGLLARFKEELLGADVGLMADYTAIWKTLVAGNKINSDVNLEYSTQNFGRVLYSYFDGLASQMKSKLNKDDMMVEGFIEAVPTLQLCVEVAPQDYSLKNSYHEIEIKDGKFIIRTTPRYFGTNSDSAAQDIVDLL